MILKFSTLTDGQQVDGFDPLNDQLVFDIPAGSTGVRYQANQLLISQTTEGLVFAFPELPAAGTGKPLVPAKRITLLGMTLEQITGRNNPVNVSFASNGLLLVGDDTPDTVNDALINGLIGSDNNDMLLGLAGDDTLTGRIGDDWLDGGADNDTLYGDAGKDRLIGGAGNDILFGGVDSDILYGGTGNDIYDIDNSGDIVVESNPSAAIGGVDTVRTVISYILTANVENLTLVDQTLPVYFSTINNINGTGNVLDNTIIGNSGFNILDGGAGADGMIGGSGDDLYIVDDPGDLVIEENNINNPANDNGPKDLGADYILIDWVDTVWSSIDYTLPAWVENLRLTGGADLNGAGNELDNIIYANTGDNVLDGRGNTTQSSASNPDEFAVLAGDTVSYQYGCANRGVRIDLTSDAPQDTLGSGIDTLIGVENVIGSPYHDVFIGDSGSNVFAGGSSLRTFEGDSGADVMIGGDGSDSYVVDGNDTVIETNTDLTQVDWVYSWSDFRLPDNVENLRLLPFSGIYPKPVAPATSGSGNDRNNIIIGNDARNRLDGGSGADTLYGGAGDDTYIVDNAGDRVFEALPFGGASPNGNDIVISTVTFSLGDGLDHLQLMGTTNINGFGNALNNTLWANRGNNVIDGGAGIDTLSYDLGARAGVTADLNLTARQFTGGSGFDTLIGIENLIGSNYGDFFTDRSAVSNTLDGGAGRDTISYAAAATGVSVNLGGLGTAGSATGGGGSDTLRNFEDVVGTAYDDTLVGTTGNNTLDGAAGIDTVSYDLAYTAAVGAGVTVDLNRRGAQNTGGSGFDTLIGVENLTGTKYDDDLTGTGEANRLIGQAGDDTLRGGGGDDLLEGGADDDWLDGGTGIDTLSYRSATATQGVTVSLGSTGAQVTGGAGTDTIANFENLIGGAGNDVLTGDGRDNVIEGLGGDDILNGGGGIDTLSYQSATTPVTLDLSLQAPTPAQQTTGGAGTDMVSNFENLMGGRGADRLSGDAGANVIDGGSGNDLLNGGGGVDTLSYQSATSGVTLNLALATPQATGGAGNDTVSNFENLLGSNFDDLLAGDANDNLLDGAAGTDTLSFQGSTGVGVVVDLRVTTPQVTGMGTDTIRNFENLRGSSGNDRLTGSAGDNLIDGGLGDDVLDGAGGLDTLSYASATSGVTVDLAKTASQPTGGGGADTIANFESLVGSSFNDTLSGTTGDNTIEGGAGNDRLDGGAGIDTLSYRSATNGVTLNLNVTIQQSTGGAGMDTVGNFENLIGGSGNDNLTGNVGDNLIEGGAGNDRLDGAGGIDTVSYRSATRGVTVDLSKTTAQVVGGTESDTLANFENLLGSGFDDVLSGTSGNNLLDGGAGVDTASYAGAGGGVTVFLSQTMAQATVGAGTDTVLNFENLIGGRFNDTLGGQAGNSVLDGGDGIDTLSYRDANAGVRVDLGVTTAQATGGAGTDTVRNFENLTGSGYNDTLSGDLGDNTLDGGAGTDTLSYRAATGAIRIDLGMTGAQDTGGAGIDTIVNFENLLGSAFADRLTGNTGSNVIDGGPGNDTLDGGAGTDTLSYQSASAGVTLSLGVLTAQQTGGGGIDTIANFENLLGSQYGDTLSGTGGTNRLDGAAGIDTLSYQEASGGVKVSLATTAAQITGGAGTDTILNFENLQGSRFNDRLTGSTAANLIDGGAGNDTLDGGTGIDTLSYQSATAGVTISLAATGTAAQVTGGSGTDTVMNFENLLGSAFNDRLTGNSGTNVIDGGAGNDILDGGTGTDTLSYQSATSGVTVNLGLTSAQVTGGAGTDIINGFENLLGSESNDNLTGNTGNNVLEGGAGYDVLNGWDGIDTASYASASGAVLVDLGVITPQSTGGAGTDVLTNIENLLGGRFGDTLWGNTDVNVLNGADGDDWLEGGDGGDTLIGGAGADTLSGGRGNDVLRGDAGNDVFRFVTAGEGADTLSDFTSRADTIQVVSDNFGNLPVGALNADRLVAVGTVLSNRNPVFLYNATTGALSFDRDGNGSAAAAQIATLAGSKTLVASDIQVVSG